jgi:hypothetical protein
MPSVKLCHQSSTNNSKPEFIMAHSMQMLSLLVEGLGNTSSAVLLSARIHEGLIFSNRDHRTLLDKMNAMIASTLGHEEQGFLLLRMLTILPRPFWILWWLKTEPCS